MVQLALNAQSIHSICDQCADDTLELKKCLRKYFKRWLDENQSSTTAARSTLGPNALWSVKDQILRNSFEKLNCSGVWASYLPSFGEIDPKVFESCFPHVRWAYPRMEGELLRFFTPEDSQSFQNHAWGLREPKSNLASEVSLDEISGFLVPGLAFSLQGQRLGRGMGYYDRTLQQTQAIKVGVCWGHQVLTEFPVENHDVRMDFILTEGFVQEG